MNMRQVSFSMAFMALDAPFTGPEIINVSEHGIVPGKDVTLRSTGSSSRWKGRKA